MFYHENEFLNYHLTTIIQSNDVVETSNWFYFRSNAPCYIQIKFRNHKLISLGTAVENIHSNIKIIQNFFVLIVTASKNKPIFFMNQQYKFSSFV